MGQNMTPSHSGYFPRCLTWLVPGDETLMKRKGLTKIGLGAVKVLKIANIFSLHSMPGTSISVLLHCRFFKSSGDKSKICQLIGLQ